MKVPHHFLHTLFPVALLSVAAAVPSQAQTLTNVLTNSDFETQNPPLAINGKVTTGFSTLTGFQNISTPSNTEDSGAQGTSNNTNQPAESGFFFVFEQGQDPGAFQITSTTLTAGERLTLTWFSQNAYLNPVQEVGILTAASPTSTFALATAVATANGSTNPTYALGAANAAYQQYTLTYTATAADAGRNVGIFLENIGPTGNYLNTDNYNLAISVPEPRTYGMVILGAAAAFFGLRRRKQTLS